MAATPDPLLPVSILPEVVAHVRVAGRMVAEEFARPDGPRFSDPVTAPVDHEIELFLRDRLTTLVPARFVGEEAGTVAGEANGYCWVVDPHDGTRAFLEGRRGSAVSVALLHNGRPVLAVVFAPTSPDRGPDLIAWADSMDGIQRNGETVRLDLRRRSLSADDVVFLNHGAWQRPVWQGTACTPARFMPLPSIAYRLARVAVGDGIATLTLRPVNALDIAAGHGLLLAAGGTLVTADGLPVTYSTLGACPSGACFGGAPAVVENLRTRAWRGATETRREPRVTLSWPRADSEQRLSRAVGCLLGQAAGDALGSLVEFRSASQIALRYPDGVRDLHDGGTWNTLAGQPTDDTELSLALARTLVGRGTYDDEAVATSYGQWYASRPFDIGSTTAAALGAAAGAPRDKASAARSAALRDSQANGSLMRVAPIGIWAGTPARAAEAAMADSALTHPHPVCAVACAAYASAIATAIGGGDRSAMLGAARDVAAHETRVAQALQRAIGGQEPEDFETSPGWVLLAFQNAFFHLAAGTAAEAAVIRTVNHGGDTDTNGAIAGALLGALFGRVAFPSRWTMPVLTCRAEAALGAKRPRPGIYWADDLPDLAEALLETRRLSR